MARGRSCLSQLPPEILDLILVRLLFPDCQSFGKVCKSWRSVFLERCRLNRPPPIILGLSGSNHFPRFGGLYEGKLLPLCSPKPNLGVAELILGSSRGWLVIASDEGNYYKPYLLNPLSNQRIALPSNTAGGSCIKPFPHCFWLDRVVLSSVPTSRDCIIAAVGSLSIELQSVVAWCTPGYPQWTRIATPDEGAKDTTFYKGELYVLDGEGDVFVYTFDLKLRNISHRVSITRIISNNYNEFQSHQLVESGGDLLMAMRGGLWHKWRFFKLVDEHGGRWVRMETLPGQFLLIGKHGIISVCTEGLMGSSFKSNCIYYRPKYLSFGLVKHSMADKNQQTLTVHDNYLLPEFDWVVPQAW